VDDYRANPQRELQAGCSTNVVQLLNNILDLFRERWTVKRLICFARFRAFQARQGL
jgi:hypothetical protein